MVLLCAVSTFYIDRQYKTARECLIILLGARKNLNHSCNIVRSAFYMDLVLFFYNAVHICKKRRLGSFKSPSVCGLPAVQFF